jgi:hypothetical protein
MLGKANVTQVFIENHAVDVFEYSLDIIRVRGCGVVKE